MSTLNQEDVSEIIIRWVRDNRQVGDFADPEINDDTDLMAAGLVDSHGFIELLLFLEEQTGRKVDLTEVDPAEFTVVKSLCNIVLGNAGDPSMELQGVRG